MKKKLKFIGLVLGIVIFYYALQYASSAVHYNCYVLKDDCVPPINLTSELVYRSIVHPRWLDQFEIKPETLSIKDGESGFFDGRNSTFTIEGKQVTLVKGISEVAIPSSSAKVTTRYFGNESKGDLMGNGNDDIAFLVSQDTGGSGLFYYVVVAYKTADGYKTTNAFLIGDRIAPQTTHIQSDARELYVNYAKRREGEPFTTQPSQGATLALKVTPDGVLEGLMK